MEKGRSVDGSVVRTQRGISAALGCDSSGLIKLNYQLPKNTHIIHTRLQQTTEHTSDIPPIVKPGPQNISVLFPLGVEMFAGLASSGCEKYQHNKVLTAHVLTDSLGCYHWMDFTFFLLSFFLR